LGMALSIKFRNDEPFQHSSREEAKPFNANFVGVADTGADVTGAFVGKVLVVGEFVMGAVVVGLPVGLAVVGWAVGQDQTCE